MVLTVIFLLTVQEYYRKLGYKPGGIKPSGEIDYDFQSVSLEFISQDALASQDGVCLYVQREDIIIPDWGKEAYVPCATVPLPLSRG